MTNEQTTQPVVDENQIIAERRAKLAALREGGKVAFPNDFVPQDKAANLHLAYDEKSKEDLEPLAITAKVAGRMMLKRVMGKASFATLQDGSGQIQLYISNDNVGAETHDAFK